MQHEEWHDHLLLKGNTISSGHHPCLWKAYYVQRKTLIMLKMIHMQVLVSEGKWQWGGKPAGKKKT